MTQFLEKEKKWHSTSKKKTNNKRHNTYKNKAKHSTQKKRQSIEKKGTLLRKGRRKKRTLSSVCRRVFDVPSRVSAFGILLLVFNSLSYFSINVSRVVVPFKGKRDEFINESLTAAESGVGIFALCVDWSFGGWRREGGLRMAALCCFVWDGLLFWNAMA